jgi:predicted GNAT family N-acyltransferase
MIMAQSFRVRLADWASDEPRLKAIRYRVFVVEQRVPEELEWDGIDAGCRHALAEDLAGNVIGCGRLLPDGHIGRMAVDAAWRGQGVGTALLECLVDWARSLGYPRLILNAQVQAMPFYARHGFTPSGPEFEEAGIAHQAMEQPLQPAA